MLLFFSDHGKQQILFILEKISALKPHERLLLYMRMPTGSVETGIIFFLRKSMFLLIKKK